MAAVAALRPAEERQDNVQQEATHAPTPAGTPGTGEMESLLHRARAGDTEAFDQIFTQCKEMVYVCLYHLLEGDREAVEDAVGNVFLAAFRSLPRFRGEASFTTYLYRIAVNEAHAQRRRWRRQRVETAFTGAEEARSDPNQPDPALIYEHAEEGRRLTRAVRALPEPYRTPIILRYLNGVPSAEIAIILKRPAGTVRYQVSRGLRLLRERMESEGVR